MTIFPSVVNTDLARYGCISGFRPYCMLKFRTESWMHFTPVQCWPQSGKHWTYTALCRSCAGKPRLCMNSCGRSYDILNISCLVLYISAQHGIASTQNNAFVPSHFHKFMHTMLLFAYIRAIHYVLLPCNRSEIMSCCLQNKNGKGGFEPWQHDQARRCLRAGALALQGVGKCSATGSCARRDEEPISMKPAPSYEKSDIRYQKHNADCVTWLCGCM